MRRIALALVLLRAAPVLAAETNLGLDYDLSYGPLRLVEVHATIDLADSRYRAATEMRTVGIAAVLFPWRAQSHSTGTQSDGGPRPSQHVSEGSYRGEPRRVEIDYAADGVVRSTIDPPPEKDWRHAVPAELQAGTIDPLSASLAIMSRNCRGSVPVFDGRRRYNLNLTDMGTAAVEAGGGQIYTGPARHCRAVVEALAGFWITDPRQSETPTTLDFWVASPAPDVPPLPVYLELASDRGTLRIRLTGVHTPPSLSAPPTPSG